MHAGNPDLVEFIRGVISREGPVTFSWFMEQALYHPQLGYYSSGRCQIGRKGDYFTNVSVGPFFGRILAAQFAEIWRELKRPESFTIVEQGAHNGDFAKDVLEIIRETDADFFASLQYWVVEPFPVLETRQRETLRDLTGKVTWWKCLKDIPEFCGIHFSNELLDAMPVHLVKREGAGEWEEKFVVEKEGRLQFLAQPLRNERLLEHLEHVPRSDQGTYETEISLAALDWIKSVAAKLRRGFVLAVDYGFRRPEFFAPERTSGTLQGYANHRPVSSPLADVGEADIAAHVEWTSLAERAERCGLAIVGFTDQHHFVTGMLSLLSPNENERRALQTLMHPEFLGTRFQYLALGKDVPAANLSGFRFARDARKALL